MNFTRHCLLLQRHVVLAIQFLIHGVRFRRFRHHQQLVGFSLNVHAYEVDLPQGVPIRTMKVEMCVPISSIVMDWLLDFCRYSRFNK